MRASGQGAVITIGETGAFRRRHQPRCQPGIAGPGGVEPEAPGRAHAQDGAEPDQHQARRDAVDGDAADQKPGPGVARDGSLRSRARPLARADLLGRGRRKADQGGNGGQPARERHIDVIGEDGGLPDEDVAAGAEQEEQHGEKRPQEGEPGGVGDRAERPAPVRAAGHRPAHGAQRRDMGRVSTGREHEPAGKVRGDAPEKTRGAGPAQERGDEPERERRGGRPQRGEQHDEEVHDVVAARIHRRLRRRDSGQGGADGQRGGRQSEGAAHMGQRLGQAEPAVERLRADEDAPLEIAAAPSRRRLRRPVRDGLAGLVNADGFREKARVESAGARRGRRRGPMEVWFDRIGRQRAGGLLRKGVSMQREVYAGPPAAVRRVSRPLPRRNRAGREEPAGLPGC